MLFYPIARHTWIVWVCLLVCDVWVCVCCCFLVCLCLMCLVLLYAVKVVGLALARDRGDSEIGGVITGKGAVETGGWVLANHWEIDEESTTRVGLQTTQTANQHQQKTSTKTQEAHKSDNSTQHTNNRISNTIGLPSKKALKINSLLRRLLGIWSKVHET